MDKNLAAKNKDKRIPAPYYVTKKTLFKIIFYKYYITVSS
jgi:hypothetical protein